MQNILLNVLLLLIFLFVVSCNMYHVCTYYSTVNHVHVPQLCTTLYIHEASHSYMTCHTAVCHVLHVFHVWLTVCMYHVYMHWMYTHVCATLTSMYV